jgi:GAF domain-containing protein
VTATPPLPAPQAPGSVQPHGVLLALDADLRVVMCSAATEGVLGVPADDVLDRPVAALLGTDVAARVAARRDEGFPGEPLVVVLGRAGDAGREVELRVHAAGDRVVVELEPVAATSAPGGDYGSVRAATTRLAAARTLGELTGRLAREVRGLTGFDRVTVLRYDRAPGGAGVEVVAEARREELPPHVGDHAPPESPIVVPRTPAPDRSARAPGGVAPALRLAPVQVVADVSAAAVPLVPPLDPATGAPLDLDRASLRSPSPAYAARLAAAGVTAALTIELVIDDEPWGAIACHHHTGPHRPDHEVRSSAEFFTQVASHLVAHRVRADAREAAACTRAEMSQLTARLTASEGGVLDAVFADPGLLSVFGATGAANYFEGALRTQGVVPDLDTMHAISDLLNEPDGYASSTDRLAALDERFAAITDVADGVLRVGTLAARWGLWFRTDGSRWQPWHIEAAEELGRHVNSLLLLRSREQVAMAESMQRSVVLDHAPAFAGVELVARYRPASSYQLGGDWWDAVELDEHRLAVVVGDAAGHGVAAASAMTQARTALRAYLYDGHGPAGCLDRLDLLMDGLLDIGVATAQVAVLDRRTGLVEIASAGHHDPLLVAPDGTARELPLDRRPLLGVGLGSAPVSQVDLSDGSLLVLFTDGLVERRGTDTDVQTARLVELAAGGLEPRPHDDLPGWADRLLAELDAVDDDTTLLALRRV